MDARLRAASIVEIAQRGDPALLKSFAYDMIINAKSEEQERCAAIADSFGAKGGIAHVIAEAIRTVTLL